MRLVAITPWFLCPLPFKRARLRIQGPYYWVLKGSRALTCLNYYKVLGSIGLLRSRAVVYHEPMADMTEILGQVRSRRVKICFRTEAPNKNRHGPKNPETNIPGCTVPPVRYALVDGGVRIESQIPCLRMEPSDFVV